MEILNYIIIAVITAAGLILGKVLAKIAKEEIKPGKKYLLIMQKALFCAVILLLMYINRTNVHYIWAGAVIIFAYLRFFKKINHLLMSTILAVAFFLASKTDYFLIISAMTFLYNFPAGSLIKNKKDVAANLLVFLAVATIMFLV